MGLDPADPSDAALDPDRDGLSNLEEYQRGTILRSADTDGDGLKDGEEVLRGTNPLLADTDGDGVPDGLEVQLGTNPLDPRSVNLAAAIDRLDVTPAAATLIVNSLSPEANVQLRVAGVLKDGSRLDLASSARGTRYSSSNLLICNFGGRDGQVFAGQDGTCVVTVTNGAFRTEVPIRVENFTPTQLSAISIPGSVAVDLVGSFAYVVGANQLTVVNVANRAAPARLGSTAVTSGSLVDVRVAGNYAYAAAGAAGLAVFDVSNQAAPRFLRLIDTPGDAQDIAIAGGNLYLADGATGLLVFDLTNRATPTLISTTALSAPAIGVAVDPARNIAVVALGTSGIQVVDVSNPAIPALRGSLAGGNVRDVAVRGTTAFLADYARSFTAVDIANPAKPVLTTSLPAQFGGLLNDVAVAGDFAFGADDYFVNDTPVIDISTPGAPAARFLLRFPGDASGTGVAADNAYVYLLASGVLNIGQYRSLSDNNGIPPQVSVVSPTPGGSLVARSTAAVTIKATDDVAVATVQLLVNGQVVGSAAGGDATLNFTVPKGVTALTIQARAVDLANNIGLSSEMGLNVIVGPLTTVTGTGVDRQGNAIRSARVSVVEEFYGQSGADGRFSITGVPAALQNVRVYGEVAVNGAVLRGRSALVPVVSGGTTDAGQLLYFPDADWDGLPDEYETANACLTLNSRDDEADPDGDGLTNFQEYELKTNPCSPNLLPGQTWVVTPLVSLRNGPPSSAVLPAGFNDVSSALVSIRNGLPPGAVLPEGLNEVSSALISVLNGGSPDGGPLPPGLNEVSSALVSLRNGLASNSQLPSGFNEVSSSLVSLRNGLTPGAVLPAGFNEISSALVSLRNGIVASPPGTSESISLPVTVSNRSLAPSAPANLIGPTLSPASSASLRLFSGYSADRQTVSVGSTVAVTYEGSADVTSVEFFVDGASLGATDAVPFTTSLVVPSGAGTLQVRALAKDRTGNVVATADQLLTAAESEARTVTVALTDAEGKPLQEIDVVVERPGLLAEVFDSRSALVEMPDLTGRTPDLVSAASSLSYRNPDGIFGSDPFGFRLSPDFAVRFSGRMQIPSTGEYRFRIRSHEGARLLIDGTTVLTVPGGTSLTNVREGQLVLDRGSHAVTVEYYATVRSPEIDWMWAVPGRAFQSVPSDALTHTQQAKAATDGKLAIAGVAPWMDVIRVKQISPSQPREAVLDLRARPAAIPVLSLKESSQ